MCNAAFAPINCTVFSASAREVRALTMTLAPPAASERAMARPMLRAAPVTRATFPASSVPGLIPTVLGKAFSSTADAGQPGGERRERDDQADQQEHASDERHPGEVDVAHRGAGRRHALHDEEKQPE